MPAILKAGLNALIATDNPGISKIALGDDYRGAHQELGLTSEILVECLMAAVKAAFLPDAGWTSLKKFEKFVYSSYS